MTFLRGEFFFVIGGVIEISMGYSSFDLFSVCLCSVSQTVPVELLSLFLSSPVKSRLTHSIFGIRKKKA